MDLSIECHGLHTLMCADVSHASTLECLCDYIYDIVSNLLK